MNRMPRRTKVVGGGSQSSRFSCRHLASQRYYTRPLLVPRVISATSTCARMGRTPPPSPLSCRLIIGIFPVTMSPIKPMSTRIPMPTRSWRITRFLHFPAREIVHRRVILKPSETTGWKSTCLMRMTLAWTHIPLETVLARTDTPRFRCECYA